MKELYEKFYEHDALKKTRNLLDGGDPAEIEEMVKKETADFTDYLNFFEFLAYLKGSRQITGDEMLGLFNYYLKNLKKTAVVYDYIQDRHKGFERLARVLKEMKA
jgi:hypothetical protein